MWNLVLGGLGPNLKQLAPHWCGTGLPRLGHKRGRTDYSDRKVGCWKLPDSMMLSLAAAAHVVLVEHTPAAFFLH